MNSSALFSRVLLAAVCLAGISRSAEAAAPSETNLRDGMFLLQDVSQRESQLHLISWIKTTPPEIIDFTKEISTVSDDTLATLTRLEKEDDSLTPSRNPLPEIEQHVRDSIREDKQHVLIFGTTGPDYVRALLVDQIEASTYMMTIAKVMSEEDTDPDRAKTLMKVSDRWFKIRRKAVQFLKGM